MERYAQMKKSGVPWVETIPESWNVRRGKTVLTLLSRPTRDEDEIITCFRDGEVTLRKNRREDGFTVALQENGYQGIEPGDLVVHGMDGFAGSIGISDSRGKATPVLNVMDSTQNKKYLMYYLRALAYKDVFMSLSTGIRVRSCDLRWNKLAVLPFLIPPIKEQDAIVTFLDSQIAQIESVIAEEKKSVEDYKRWRASIISEAVLGINNNREKKRSGVEWIDEIPANWDIVRLKTLFSFGKGLSITKDNLAEEGIPVISYGQIHSKINPGTEIVDGLIRYVPDSYLESNPESLVHKGDILIADTSEDTDGCGNAVYVNAEMQLFAGYHTIILKSINGKDNKYLSYLFRTDAWRSQIRARVSGVKLFSISKKILNQVSVVLPPYSEQVAIVSELDDKCKMIDSIIAEKESLMSDLEKYKRSLIYDTVTGKRKVV